MLYKTLLSLLVISLPAMAHAQIYSNTSASSNTGGNVVGPGGSITTGNAVSSVQVSNTGNQGTSSSSVYIKTEANGTVHEETITTTKGRTDVSVQTTPKGTHIEVREGTPPKVVRQEYIASAGTSTGPSGATSTEDAPAAGEAPASPGLGTQIVLAVQSIFRALLGWFR